MSVATHYDTLKVTRNAPPEVITAAYKALAQKYHPDRNVGNAEAVQMMQVINAAYRALSDTVKKADHDRWIAAQDPPKAPPPLTPQEQVLKQKSDETAAEAKKWGDWANKTVAEAKAARDKANKVAEQMKAASPDRKSAFETMYAREDAIAKTEEAKAAEAQKKAQEAAAVAMKHAFSKDGKGPPTHYDTLKVTPDAPMEVIQAAARALAQKLQASENATALAAVNNAFAFLTDPAKKAEHDSHIQKSAPKPVGAAQQVARKETAREIDAKAKAAKAEADAVALEAFADRIMKEEKAAAEKAAQAAKDAAAKAKDKDAEKWKAWAAKTATDAQYEKNRSAKAAAQAAQARLKAQAAHNEVAEAKADADKEAAMWNKG